MSNLEFALVADGVPASDVYDYMEDNGIDRALDKLTDLCTNPNGGCIFWSAGAQPPEQLVLVKLSWLLVGMDVTSMPS